MNVEIRIAILREMLEDCREAAARYEARGASGGLMAKMHRARAGAIAWALSLAEPNTHTDLERPV